MCAFLLACNWPSRSEERRWGGGIPKPAEISEVVGNGSEGAGNDRSNGAGPGIYL